MPLSDSHRVTASWDTLLKGASETADSYLHYALRATEELPEGVDRTAVLVAHMRTASEDFRTAAISVAAQQLSDALDNIGDVLRSMD